MVRLAVFENPRLAQAFIDYMAARQIEVVLLPQGDNQFALWLQDVQHQVEVEAELALFMTNPNLAKYQEASWQVAEQRLKQPTVLRYHSPSIGAMLKAKAGIVTLSIMLICSVIYTLQVLGLGQQIFSVLHFPADMTQKWQGWRWISHALLHFSITHILFNLLWWWQLGGDIEKKFSSTKLLQLFILSAVLSGAAQFWVGGANFGGLSGVVYALLGYLWVLPYCQPNLGALVPKPTVVFMLVWLVLGFVQPFMAIANSAHLAGLVTGCLLAWLDGNKKVANPS